MSVHTFPRYDSIRDTRMTSIPRIQSWAFGACGSPVKVKWLLLGQNYYKKIYFCKEFMENGKNCIFDWIRRLNNRKCPALLASHVLLLNFFFLAKTRVPNPDKAPSSGCRSWQCSVSVSLISKFSDSVPCRKERQYSSAACVEKLK